MIAIISSLNLITDTFFLEIAFHNKLTTTFYIIYFSSGNILSNSKTIDDFDFILAVTNHEKNTKHWFGTNFLERIFYSSHCLRCRYGILNQWFTNSFQVERRGNSTNFRKAFNLVLIKLFNHNENLFVQNWRKERKHIITKKVTTGIKDGRWLNILLEFTVFSVFSEKVGLKYGDFCRMP